MNKAQKQVQVFNRAIETPRSDVPSMPDENVRLLRARLILEEALECVNALGFKIFSDQNEKSPWIESIEDLILSPDYPTDMPSLVDGLCDLNYVSYGTADAIGIDLEPFFDEVHAANMQKLKGPIDPYGKRLKPEGWQPPRIEEMLKQIGGVEQEKQSPNLFMKGIW